MQSFFGLEVIINEEVSFQKIGIKYRKEGDDDIQFHAQDCLQAFDSIYRQCKNA